MSDLHNRAKPPKTERPRMVKEKKTRDPLAIFFSAVVLVVAILLAASAVVASWKLLIKIVTG